ncbi:MAG: hypothetical protein SGI74_13155 [Oligoflexia bacterium]|nr:hypothetical protein [Oligoflexia bacterium]
MKGLSKIPTIKELQKSYDKIQSDEDLSLEDLSLFTQWSRFDPRLTEQLIQYFNKHWKKIHPVLFNEEICKQPWPTVVGVLLEFVSHLTLKPSRKLFKNWMNCVLSGVEVSSMSQFYIGIWSLGGAQMYRSSENSLKPFLKWGFLSDDVPFNKSLKKPTTLSSLNVRMKILNKLIQENQIITVESYMLKLNGTVSRRQAERDLAQHKDLRAKGFTRNRVYHSM